MGKAEEYKRKLQEFEKKVEEEAKYFNIDDFLNVVHEKYVEGIGVIRYRIPSLIELYELTEKHRNDTIKLTTAIITAMLSKADASITFEKVASLPMDIFLKISRALTEEIKNFLSSIGIELKGGLDGTS